MLEIVRELPDGVELSAKLRESAPFYLLVTLFGVPYYVAATQDVRLLFELGADGKYAPRDRRRKFGVYEKADALRDIVASISLQVRDVELAGVEQNVTRELLDRMREAMRPTVRRLINRRTKKLSNVAEIGDARNVGNETKQQTGD